MGHPSRRAIGPSDSGTCAAGLRKLDTRLRHILQSVAIESIPQRSQRLLEHAAMHGRSRHAQIGLGPRNRELECATTGIGLALCRGSLLYKRAGTLRFRLLVLDVFTFETSGHSEIRGTDDFCRAL